MKKLFLVIILLSACILFSGCQKKQERPTLDYKRKLSKYLPEVKKEYNKSYGKTSKQEIKNLRKVVNLT